MRLQTAILSILVTLTIAATTYADAAKADFSGTWELDKEKSEGLPGGAHQKMIVKQTGDRLDIEIETSGPQGNRKVTDSYIVNGKEAEFTPALVGGGTSKGGKRTSTWSAEGKGFDATEEATIEGEEGTDTIKGTRKWQLSPDGKSLTIEMQLEGSQGQIKSKRVFVKQ